MHFMDTSILWFGCRTVASWNSVFQPRPFWMVSLVKPPAWRRCSSLHFCAIYSASSFRLCWSPLCAACGAGQTEVSGYPLFFTSVQGASSACLRLPSACAAGDDSVSCCVMPYPSGHCQWSQRVLRQLHCAGALRWTIHPWSLLPCMMPSLWQAMRGPFVAHDRAP